MVKKHADLGLLFKDEMVLAIRDEHKTETRRIANTTAAADTVWRQPEPGYFVAGKPGTVDGDRLIASTGNGQRIRVGQTLWVREAWRVFAGTVIQYRADKQTRSIQWQPDGTFKTLPRRLQGVVSTDKVCWKSPIHLPRYAARIECVVTNIKLERLHAITDEGALAEGVRLMPGFRSKFYGVLGCNGCESIITPQRSPREAFAKLWEHIHGVPWQDCDQWVWVIQFKRVYSDALYSVGIWDTVARGFVAPWWPGQAMNVDRGTLRKLLRELFNMGYIKRRQRSSNGGPWGERCKVFVERTGGRSQLAVMRDWQGSQQ